jgi:hypothetical protein
MLNHLENVLVPMGQPVIKATETSMLNTHNAHLAPRGIIRMAAASPELCGMLSHHSQTHTAEDKQAAGLCSRSPNVSL